MISIWMTFNKRLANCNFSHVSSLFPSPSLHLPWRFVIGPSKTFAKVAHVAVADAVFAAATIVVVLLLAVVLVSTIKSRSNKRKSFSGLPPLPLIKLVSRQGQSVWQQQQQLKIPPLYCYLITPPGTFIHSQLPCCVDDNKPRTSA